MKNKEVILCVGDSLGLPRDSVPFEKTWLYKLSCEYDDKIFINGFKREFTSEGLYSFEALENYMPDKVILQIGIVDCAPRFHKKDALLPKIINRTPTAISKVFWKWFKHFKKREMKNAFVSREDFRRNLSQYFERCLKIGVCQIIVILIQKPGSTIILKSPAILEAVKTYNKILQEIGEKYGATIINPLFSGEDYLYVSDGYHLNEAGFDAVKKSLDRFFNN